MVSQVFLDRKEPVENLEHQAPLAPWDHQDQMEREVFLDSLVLLGRME